MTEIRPAAVAGMFYPAAAHDLARQVADMLEAAQPRAAARPVPKAIIAPHAGYSYSGPVAASIYARLSPARGRFTRVVLLGPTHRVPVWGLVLPDTAGFATPLGVVPVDGDAVQALARVPQVTVSSAAHALEHSLEVHLPFLQQMLDGFALVPLAVGDANPEEVAQVIDALWGGDETLIVVSSDLSHYLSYREAQVLDQATARAILDLRSDITHEQACGGTPVNGLTLAARRRGMQAEVVDLRNSGDTSGDKRRVVGYGAFAFMEARSDVR